MKMYENGEYEEIVECCKRVKMSMGMNNGRQTDKCIERKI